MALDGARSDLARGLAARRGTLPEGSFVALAGGEIVGFSGLCVTTIPGSPRTA